MNNSTSKTYVLNVVNYVMICFIIQIILTIIVNPPNENAEFNGSTIWLFFIFFIIYKIGIVLKNDKNIFISRLLQSLVILYVTNNFYTIFNVIDSNYFGYGFMLYEKVENPAIYKNFLFWQTGVLSGYNFYLISSNFIDKLFIVPIIGYLECLIKAIYPDLFIVLIIQIPFIIKNKKFLNWTTE
ncbi:MAG TPA: hypothetical protein PLL09_03920 [Flavobacterium sp.]|uniref:hypothetical protein n=1 Tax=unclassified Flavobacterium TaxID=196869 RepID=UPI0025C484C3|nr:MULTISPECIES: hypothetical protein [unclassified Flavobacterium]HRE76953.1 hypothetical protein [Flavobacterium sp.]